MKKKMLIAMLMTMTLLTACGKGKEQAEIPPAMLTEQAKPQYELTDEKDEVLVTEADEEKEKANATGDEAPEPETIEDVAYANQILEEENADYEPLTVTMYVTSDTSAYEQPTETSNEITKLKKGSAVAVWSQDTTGQWAAVKITEKDGYVDKNLLVKDKEESLKAETGKTVNTSPQEQQGTEVQEQATQPTPDTEVQAPAETQPPQEAPAPEAGSNMTFTEDEQRLIELGILSPNLGPVDNPDCHEQTEEEKREREKWLEEFNKEHPNITVG